MGVQVQVSARILRWPRMCACCLNPVDGTGTATLHQVRWKKRHPEFSTSSWQIPYCERCLVHIQALDDVDSHGVARGYGIMAIGAVCGMIVSCGSCCCIPAAIGPIHGKMTQAQVGLFVAGLFVSGGLGAIIFSLAFMRGQRSVEEAKRMKAHGLLQVAALAGPSCSSARPAVRYEAQEHGHIHTFWFENAAYAEAFKRANREKLLGWN